MTGAPDKAKLRKGVSLGRVLANWQSDVSRCWVYS